MTQARQIGNKGVGNEGAGTSTYKSIFVGFDGGGGISTEANSQCVARTVGTFTKLYVRVTSNDRGASTFKFRKNNADGNQSISIGSSSTGEFEDTTNSDTVAAGDLINAVWNVGTGGSSAVQTISAVNFEASSGFTAYLGGNNQTNVTADSSTLAWAFGSSMGASNTEAAQQIKTYSACTLSNMSCYVSLNTRSTTSTVVSRIGGVTGNISVSIAGAATGQFEDTTHSDSVSANSLINGATITSTGGGTLRFQIAKIEYTSTDLSYPSAATNGANTGTSRNAGTTEYVTIGGGQQTVTDAQSQTKAAVTATIDHLQVYVVSNGASASSTVTFRKNAAGANNTVTFSSAATGLFEDTTHSDSITTTDELNTEIVTGAGGTTVGYGTIAYRITLPAAAASVSRMMLMGVGP